MKLLFISANEEWLPDPVPPIGVAYVAAAAREDGHVCTLFDCNFQSAEDALADELVAFQPDVIGLSIRNVDNAAFPVAVSYLEHYQRIARVCHDTCPEIPLVLGGSAFSLFPEQFLDRLDGDYGIVGEGENLLRALLRSLQEKGEPAPNRNPGPHGDPRIYYNTELEAEPGRIRPARDLMDVDGYFQQGGSINIQTKRGCAYRCAYCTYPLLEGVRIRKRPPAEVVDEIEFCLNHFGVDYFFFVDSVFNLPGQHAMDIAEEILRRKLKIRWTAYMSPAKTTERMFAVFREAGCMSTDFGTDAASGVPMSALDKSFDVEEIKNCSRWCRKVGIKFNHSLLFGAPGETRETIEETIENISLCNPTAVTVFIGVRLYPGTPLTRRLVREGWIREEQIDVQPVFYVEEGVREYLLQHIGEVADRNRNWIVPGLKKQMDERFFRRVRSRGVKGPLWEFFP
ncbi:MAG: radical SAM protein [bacterium]|nr:radical SAM protein [bacterium]